MVALESPIPPNAEVLPLATVKIVEFFVDGCDGFDHFISPAGWLNTGLWIHQNPLVNHPEGWMLATAFGRRP